MSNNEQIVLILALYVYNY